MSVEALKAFGQKVLEDQELKNKAKKVGMNNMEGIISLAKEYGFELSKEDFASAAKEFESSDELSDVDLEQVAGGVTVVAACAAVSAAAAVTSCVAQGGW